MSEVPLHLARSEELNKFLIGVFAEGVARYRKTLDAAVAAHGLDQARKRLSIMLVQATYWFVQSVLKPHDAFRR